MLESGLFDREAIARLLEEHARGAFDHAQIIWLLLAFEGFLAALAELPAPRPDQQPIHQAA
jgi:asparagine synthase (glutamine-hydrolysing)